MSIQVLVLSLSFGSTEVGRVWETLIPHTHTAGGQVSLWACLARWHDLLFWSAVSEKQLSDEECGDTPFSDGRKGWALRLQEGPRH